LETDTIDPIKDYINYLRQNMQTVTPARAFFRWLTICMRVCEEYFPIASEAACESEFLALMLENDDRSHPRLVYLNERVAMVEDLSVEQQKAIDDAHQLHIGLDDDAFFALVDESFQAPEHASPPVASAGSGTLRNILSTGRRNKMPKINESCPWDVTEPMEEVEPIGEDDNNLIEEQRQAWTHLMSKVVPMHAAHARLTEIINIYHQAKTLGPKATPDEEFV
jgi:hypothetical protein